MDDPTARLLAGLVLLLLVAMVGLGTLLALIAVRRKHDRRQRAASQRTQFRRERGTRVPDAWAEAGRRFNAAAADDADNHADDATDDRDAPDEPDADPDDRHRPPNDRS